MESNIPDHVTPSWTCTTCSETMNIFHRADHLASKTHFHKLAQSERPIPKPPPTTSAIPGVSLWHCEICNHGMNIFYKLEHLASESHTKALREKGILVDAYSTTTQETSIPHDSTPPEQDLTAPKQSPISPTANDWASSAPDPSFPLELNFHCGVCNALIPIVSIAGHLETSAQWQCVGCSQLVHVDWKEGHLDTCAVDDSAPQGGNEAVAEHLQEQPESESDDEVDYTSAAEDLPAEEDDGGVQLDEEYGGASQLKQVQDSQPPTTQSGTPLVINRTNSSWDCEICEMSMPLANMVSHLNGKRHRNCLIEYRKPAQSYPTEDEGVPVIENPGTAPKTMEKTQDAMGGGSGEPKKSAIAPMVAVSENWKCIVCDRTMPAGDRDAHLSGKRHREHDFLQKQAAIKKQKEQQQLEEKRKKEQQKRQDEELKNEKKRKQEEKRKKDEKKREEERKRQEAERKSEEKRKQDEKVRNAEKEELEKQRIADEERKKKEQAKSSSNWECTLCKMAMSINSRSTHLSGRKHLSQEKAEVELKHKREEARKIEEIKIKEQEERQRQAEQLKAEEVQKQTSQAQQEMNSLLTWECIICKRKMNPDQQKQHLSGSKHKKQEKLHQSQSQNTARPEPAVAPPSENPQANSPWECTVCERIMNLDLKSPHLASLAHRKALWKQHKKHTLEMQRQGDGKKEAERHTKELNIEGKQWREMQLLTEKDHRREKERKEMELLIERSREREMQRKRKHLPILRKHGEEQEEKRKKKEEGMKEEERKKTEERENEEKRKRELERLIEESRKEEELKMKLKEEEETKERELDLRRTVEQHTHKKQQNSARPKKKEGRKRWLEQKEVPEGQKTEEMRGVEAEPTIEEERRKQQANEVLRKREEERKREADRKWDEEWKKAADQKWEEQWRKEELLKEEAGDMWDDELQSQDLKGQKVEQSQNSEPEGSSWECKICKRRMPTSNRDSHLAGVTHRKKVLRYQRRPQGQPKPQKTVRFEPEAEFLSPPTESKDLSLLKANPAPRSPWLMVPTISRHAWVCNLCEKIMDAKWKALHLASRTHQQELHKLQKPSNFSESPTSESRGWTCNVCEMGIASAQKEVHLSSKHHRHTLQKLTAELKINLGWVPRQSSCITGMCSCKSCWNALRLSEIIDNLPRPKRQRPKLLPAPIVPPVLDDKLARVTAEVAAMRSGKWDCRICARTMSVRSKDAHLRGSKHKIQIKKLIYGPDWIPAPRRSAYPEDSVYLTRTSSDTFYCECGSQLTGRIWCYDCDVVVNRKWIRKGTKYNEFLRIMGISR